MKIRILFFMSVVLSSNVACVTTGSNDRVPEIGAEQTPAQAIELAIRHGGKTLEAAKTRLSSTPDSQAVRTQIESQLIGNKEALNNYELVNAMHLYRALGPQNPWRVFAGWVRASQPIARQLAWQLAYHYPTPAMREAVDRELTRALAQGEENAMFVPEMAKAITANNLKEAYSVMRLGLMSTGSVEFVEALAQLDPWRASEDFLAYLRKAPIEELRQLNMSTVNVYACMAILRHYLQYPVSIGNPDFSHLFLFGISRNNGLAELAGMVLNSYVPDHGSHIALLLSRMPVWVQLAYLEKLRRDRPLHMGVFLSHLKEVAAHPDLVAELEDMAY